LSSDGSDDVWFSECKDKSIAELYTLGRAWNIVTSNTKVGSKKESFVKNRPDAIICTYGYQKTILYFQLITPALATGNPEPTQKSMISGWPDALMCGEKDGRGYV